MLKMAPAASLAVLVLLDTPCAFSQMADVRSAWVFAAGNAIAAAARFPEAEYGFRPAPGVRSFAELAAHVASAQFAFCGPLVPQSPPSPAGTAKLTAKADVMRALKNSVALCTTAADRMSNADATQPIAFFGRERAKITVLWANIAHSSEHYGNMVTYLRMKGITPPSSDTSALRNSVYHDQAHGQNGPPPAMAEIGSRAGFHTIVDEQPITPAALKNTRVLYLRAPSKAFSKDEKGAILGFVKAGGSLLLVVDEEQRQPLAATGVNDLLEPFGMHLTPDTPYLHNCGAIAKAGEINASDRELPYSGGRAIEGGTAFAYQLTKDGKPGAAFAAYARVDGGGRVVAMGEGMASIFLGTPEGVRLSGLPRDARGTVYWGKDSSIFMEEVLAWLVKR